MDFMLAGKSAGRQIAVADFPSIWVHNHENQSGTQEEDRDLRGDAQARPDDLPAAREVILRVGFLTDTPGKWMQKWRHVFGSLRVH